MNRLCWCQQGSLEPFNENYLRCNACQTLVAIETETIAIPGTAEELNSFYSLDYWLEHQSELGNPDIYQRIREDLIDRCLYWLKQTLRYKLPPGSSLELGSSHGAFVYLLQKAGFTATGLELNPGVTELAKKAFNIPVLSGPVEDQSIEPASLDLIVLMDVLEHLPDPVGTIRTCERLLKPEGVLVIQTPCYPAGADYATLVAQNHPFLKMLLPQEHLYLFSQPSTEEFLKQCGFPYLCFEPAVFAEHDLFVFASKSPLQTNDWPAVESQLAVRPEGRLVLGLLDLKQKNAQTDVTLAEVEVDRANRLDMIIDLNRQLAELNQQVETLRSALAEANLRLAKFEKVAQLPPVRAIRKILKF